MSSKSKIIAETQLGGHSNQTGAIDIPVGTTAQRPSNPSSGYTRMNSDTNTMEMYNGSTWVTVGGTSLKVYSVDPSTFDGSSGTSLTLIGEGFESGATVHFISSANGSQTIASSVTYVSATELTVTTPALVVAGEPWSIKVTNPDGISAAIESILDAGGSPTWTTASGQIGGDAIQGSAFSTTVAATDPDGQTVSYSESGTTSLTGSGGVGAGELGFTIDSSTGVVSGTMPSLSSDQNFNFTLGASDGVNTTTRNFFIVGKAGTPTVNYLYGGAVTTDYSVHGTYGISGGMANGFYSHGSANYSNNDRIAYTSGYPGSASGAGSIPSDEIHTQDGYEDGYFYFNCGGSGSTGVGISVGWYTGRMYIPADHDRLRIELWSNSFASNQSSTGGGLAFTFHSSVNSSGYAFNGTTYTSHGANSFTDGLSKTTGNRFSDWDISSNVSTINGAAHYLTFYSDGGQYSDSRHSVYRVASYNSAIGL
jgi:hypothetical protein